MGMKFRVAWLGAVALTLAGSVLTVGCGANDTAQCVGGRDCAIALTIVDYCGYRNSSDYFELAVFEGGCPSDADQANGLTSSAIDRKVVGATDAVPSTRELEPKPHGLIGVFRNADCQVQAWGCVEADISRVTEIRLAVLNWEDATRCVPARNLSCRPGEGCFSGICQ